MIHRRARPYAKSLLAAAPSDEAASAARDHLAAFGQALAAVPALGRMATNPAIPMAVKVSVLDEVAQHLGLGELIVRLLKLLLTNYRLSLVPVVLAAVDDILQRRLGIVTARVRSAEPLDAEQRTRLAATLANMFDRQVELELAVDTELLGGFVAVVGSRRYDASLRGQLRRLASSLAGAEQ